jgi:hypothetical protein
MMLAKSFAKRSSPFAIRLRLLTAGVPTFAL